MKRGREGDRCWMAKNGVKKSRDLIHKDKERTKERRRSDYEEMNDRRGAW